MLGIFDLAFWRKSLTHIKNEATNIITWYDDSFVFGIPRSIEKDTLFGIEIIEPWISKEMASRHHHIHNCQAIQAEIKILFVECNKEE